MVKKGRNSSIEGLRGFSALLVILFHCYNMAVEAHLCHPFANPLAVGAMAILGEFAVDLFFIISGYLIIGSLIKHGDVGLFLQNRAFRIYPVFLIPHLILFIAGPLIGYEWMGALRHDPIHYGLHFASNVFFLPGIFTGLPIAQKNAWSLSYEWAFYLISSICYIAITHSKQRSIALKIPLYLLALSLCAIVLWFHPRCWYFVIGVFAYYVTDRMGGKIWNTLTWFGVDVIALVGSFACLTQLPALALALALIAFLFLIPQKGLLSLIFRSQAMQFLGMISYSLYLLHPFVLFPLRSQSTHIATRYSSGSNIITLLFFVIGMTGSILLATASYYGIEKKFTNWLKSKLTTPRPSAAPSLPTVG